MVTNASSSVSVQKDASDIEKRVLKVLKTDGSNYLIWKNMTMQELTGAGLDHVLDTPTRVPAQNSAAARTARQEDAKCMIILQKNLDDELLITTQAISNPRVLWAHLATDYERNISLLKQSAEEDYYHLRCSDYSSIKDYNKALSKRVNDLTHCGIIITDEKKIKKTLDTFDTKQADRVHMLTMMNFTTYKDLYEHLLKDENQKEIMIRNSQLNLPGYKPVKTPITVEANSIQIQDKGNYKGKNYIENYRGRGNSRCSHGYRGNRRGGRGGYNQPRKHDKSNEIQNNTTICFSCGLKGHKQFECMANRRTKELYAELQKLKKGIASHGEKKNGFVPHPGTTPSRHTETYSTSLGNNDDDFSNNIETYMTTN